MSSILSSCEITGTLGLITLSGATVLDTLGDGTVICTLGGASVGTSLGTNFTLVLFGCCGCILLKSVANLSMSCNWLSLIVKGFLSPGLFIICTSSLAALVDCSVVYNPGIMRCRGKNYTTYACIYLLVFGVYQVWHRQWCINGPMYHASTPCIPQVLRCYLFSFTNTFIPIGTRGVLLKSNGTSIAVCANIVGFCCQGLNVLKFIVACGMRRHQRCMGKWVYLLASPAIKWYFHVLMARSDAFTGWMCGSTNWYPISSCWLYFFSIYDASLSIQFDRGL